MNTARAWIIGAFVATIFGAWLRWHGLGEQIVMDDEWHSLHKLMGSDYLQIFGSFGFADHSIPLTLLYKAIADNFGLDEISMRILQVACGTALVALAAHLAWRATQRGAVAMLFVVFVAAAPFLVLYSRLARPYAITTLLTVAALALIWRWRARRSTRDAIAICALVAVSAWFHPISALMPAIAMLFILVEDAMAPRGERAARVRSIVALGVASAIAIAIPLAAPLINDHQSLFAKAGGHHANAYTIWRMLSLFCGGLPDPLTVALFPVIAFGAWRLTRSHSRLGAYLAILAIVPPAVIALLGAQFSVLGHTFGRYVFPVQLIVLFWLAYGLIDLADVAARRRSEAIEHAAALAIAAAYLAMTPTVRQVLTLGPWYGHLYHHLDYVPMHNQIRAQYAAFEVPAFYRKLGKLPPGSTPIIEAPFTVGAPTNPFAFYAQTHRQPEKMGMIHDLCMSGPADGEVPPRDPRFRFRDFVPLDDPAAARLTGARYIVLQLDYWRGEPFADAPRCLEALARIYGAPVERDSRVAVFDLGR